MSGFSTLLFNYMYSECEYACKIYLVTKSTSINCIVSYCICINRMWYKWCVRCNSGQKRKNSIISCSSLSIPNATFKIIIIKKKHHFRFDFSWHYPNSSILFSQLFKVVSDLLRKWRSCVNSLHLLAFLSFFVFT